VTRRQKGGGASAKAATQGKEERGEPASLGNAEKAESRGRSTEFAP